MNSTAEEKKLAFLKGEIPAFESRLAGIKSELESLGRQRDKLKADIEEDKARHNADVAEKRTILSREQGELHDGRVKLAEDKKEFQAILEEFNKKRLTVDREIEAARVAKAEAKAAFDRAAAFFVLVRNEANKL